MIIGSPLTKVHVYFTDGYNLGDIEFHWMGGSASVFVDSALELPEFNLSSYRVGDCSQVYITGAWKTPITQNSAKQIQMFIKNNLKLIQNIKKTFISIAMGSKAHCSGQVQHITSYFRWFLVYLRRVGVRPAAGLLPHADIRA